MSPGGAGHGPNWAGRIVFEIFVGLIVAGLIAAGTWLAGREVPTKTVLQFSLSQTRVGALSTCYVRLSNDSPYAFDLEFAKPTQEILRLQYEPPSTDSPGWKGRLLRGTSLQALFVIDSPNVDISENSLKLLVKATYQERDERTGLLESRNAVLQEASAVSFSRTLLLVFWFLVPFGVAGLMIFGVQWLIRVIRARGAPPQSVAPPA